MPFFGDNPPADTSRENIRGGGGGWQWLAMVGNTWQWLAKDTLRAATV